MLGAERVVLELSKETHAYGYESIICALHGADEPIPELIRLAREAGIQTELLRVHGRLDPLLFMRLRRLLRDLQADLLHCHGYKENFYGFFAGTRLPILATNHLWKRTSRALRFYCWLDARISRHFDRVIAVSEPIRQELLEAGVPSSRIATIANGIDCTPFQYAMPAAERAAIRDTLGITPDHFVVGMISRLGVEKGHRHAIAALARLHRQFPQLVLVIVGDGPQLTALRATAMQLGVSDAIRFCGKRSDVSDLLHSFDAFLLPSLVEGLPMALLEAMASNLPVIASRVGDVPTVIRDGESGLLVSPGDVQALTTSLAQLASNADLCTRLGKVAADTIIRRFSARQMAAQYCQIYDQLQQDPATVMARRQED
jgi:glycosyltransferase involved in cell wall biosynthesis